MGIPLVMMSHTQVNQTTTTTIDNNNIVIQACIHYQERCSLERFVIIIDQSFNILHSLLLSKPLH